MHSRTTHRPMHQWTAELETRPAHVRTSAESSIHAWERLRGSAGRASALRWESKRNEERGESRRRD